MSQSTPAKAKAAETPKAKPAEPAVVETVEAVAAPVEAAPVEAAPVEAVAKPAAKAKAAPAALKTPPIVDKAALKANADQILATVKKAQVYSTEAVKKAQTYSVDAAKKAQAYSTEAVKKAQTYSTEAVKKAKTYSKDNVDAFVASVSAANKGACAIRVQSLMLPQTLFLEAASAAKTLSSAKSVQDVVDVYGSYATSLLKLHLSEVNKASTTMSTAFAETVKPIKQRIDQTIAAVR